MTWGNASHWGQYLAAFGVPGLFTVALIDSAAVPIVGGLEALTMLLAWRQPSQLLWVVLAGALGATLGNLIFYRFGHTGSGLAFSRLSPKRQEWLTRQVTRHAFWALFACVALPPPFPTKPLMLAAGVVRTPMATFLPAVFAGRLLRYSAVGYAGFRFGDQAARIIAANYPLVLLIVAGLVILGLLGRAILRRSPR